MFYVFEPAGAAPPIAGDFSVGLRQNAPGPFSVALADLSAFSFAVQLQDNGAGAFDVAFTPSIPLSVDFSVTPSFGVLTLGPTGTFSVSFSVTPQFSAGITQDPFTPSLVGAISVGAGPIGSVSDGTDLWVANYSAATVSRIDLVTRTILATVPMPEGSGPCSCAYDDEAIWVALALAKLAAKINRTTNEVVALVPLESYPRQALFDGTDVWFTQNTSASEGAFAVTVFNPTPGGGESVPEDLTITGSDPDPLPS